MAQTSDDCRIRGWRSCGAMWPVLLVTASTILAETPRAAAGPGRDVAAPPSSPQQPASRTKLTTAVVPAEAVWDWTALQGGYDVLDAAPDAATRQVTWTLRTKPRMTVNRDYQVAFFDHGGRPIADAPLAWSKGRRESGTVHLASLDLAWLSRRLGGRTKDIALVSVRRHDEREYGRSRHIASREERLAKLPKQLMTKALPDGVQWDHAGFESCYQVLKVSLDGAASPVVWQLEPMPRSYGTRAFRAVLYDAAGKPLEEQPLLWSEGRRDAQRIAIAELDVGYLAERLKDRAKSVARVVIERYED
jgi:hypothetical protein